MNTHGTRPWQALVATLALFLIPDLGHGMEFSVRNFSGVSEITMAGEIVPGDYDRLITFAIQNNLDLSRSVAVLHSPGGDVTEALKLGRLMKDLYMKAYVLSSTGPCASACCAAAPSSS